MNDPRHASIMDVFLRACELTDTARDHFLEQACGDDETLRAEVSSLLRHHQFRTILDQSHAIAGESGWLDVRTRMLERQQRSSTDWRRELGRLPLSFWLSILVGITVLLLAFWTRSRIHDSLRTSLRQDLTTVLEADVSALQYWIARQKLEVESWSEHVDVRQLAKRLVAVCESAQDSTRSEALSQAPESGQLLELLEPIHGRPGILGVIVFSRDGFCLIHTIDSMVGVAARHAADPYLAQVLTGKTVLVKPTTFAGFDLSVFGPVMGVAAPIRENATASLVGCYSCSHPTMSTRRFCPSIS